MDENNLPAENKLPDIEPEKNDNSVRAETYSMLQDVVKVVLICVLLFSFFIRLVGVVGSSMVPTLHDGDFLITSRLFYTPQQGDVVVLRKDTFDSRAIVKRVIALEGQTVDIDFDAGVVYVDGVALQEDYVNAPTLRRLDFNGEITVPEGCIFVLGDNRNESADSRSQYLGCVDTRYVIGRALVVLLPFRDMKLLQRP